MALGLTVRELLARVDGRELAEWEAYAQIEPWGEWRADYRAALVASVIANANRGKGTKPFTPADFMPEFGKEPAPPQTIDEQVAVFEMLKRGR